MPRPLPLDQQHDTDHDREDRQHIAAVGKAQGQQSLWDLALQLGHRSLAAFLASHRTGDIGPTATLPDGHTAQRLPELHALHYRSIFGTFKLQRTVYGTREGQALEFVPLDNRLQLPRNGCSYLLQDWDQALAMEQPFGQVNQTIQRMLKLTQSVDSLENTNRQMARDVGDFRDLQAPPPAAEEGQLVGIIRVSLLFSCIVRKVTTLAGNLAT